LLGGAIERKLEQVSNVAISEAFLSFLASIFGNYYKYFDPTTFKFQQDVFCQEQPRALQPVRNSLLRLLGKLIKKKKTSWTAIGGLCRITDVRAIYCVSCHPPQNGYGHPVQDQSLGRNTDGEVYSNQLPV